MPRLEIWPGKYNQQLFFKCRTQSGDIYRHPVILAEHWRQLELVGAVVYSIKLLAQVFRFSGSLVTFNSAGLCPELGLQMVNFY
jgi:hypothetical protein